MAMIYTVHSFHQTRNYFSKTLLGSEVTMSAQGRNLAQFKCCAKVLYIPPHTLTLHDS